MLTQSMTTMPRLYAHVVPVHKQLYYIYAIHIGLYANFKLGGMFQTRVYNVFEGMFAL